MSLKERKLNSNRGRLFLRIIGQNPPLSQRSFRDKESVARFSSERNAPDDLLHLFTVTNSQSPIGPTTYPQPASASEGCARSVSSVQARATGNAANHIGRRSHAPHETKKMGCPREPPFRFCKPDLWADAEPSPKRELDGGRTCKWSKKRTFSRASPDP